MLIRVETTVLFSHDTPETHRIPCTKYVIKYLKEKEGIGYIKKKKKRRNQIGLFRKICT